MDRYAEVFDARGHKYDTAMRAFPSARDEEFRQLFRNIDMTAMRTVYDVPSGGGYLNRFIAPTADLILFEPSADFGSYGTRAVDLERLALPAGAADLVVSLAAVHHVSNKAGFFESALQALRLGGWFCVGDVAKGSNISRFLDGFVGAHNGMGHSGAYLEAKPAIYEAIAGKHAELVRCEVAPCQWHFGSAADLAKFSRSLFGLIDVSDSLILDELHELVGIETADAGVALNWELLYLQFHA